MEKNQEFKQIYLLNFVVEPNQRPITQAFLSCDKMYEYIKLLKLRMYQITSVDLVDVDNEQTDSETIDN